MSLSVGYALGTHRIVPPETTLSRIEPLLAGCGITRAADVTTLDELGVPVYCAIRPNAMTLQVSNGKGLTHLSAKVSALMEAIELQHAETPEPERLAVASARELRVSGCTAIAPDQLEGFEDVHWSPDSRIEWVEGEDLQSGRSVFVPSSAVFFGRTPRYHSTTTNGLASGNHLIEATLHALYELVERDAAASLSVNGRMLVRERCRIVDPETIETPELLELVRRIEAADTKVFLAWLPSRIPVHTFWAVLLNRRPMASLSTLNLGWGTHLNLSVAACRALTEAAQSRLTMIHGARDDIVIKPGHQAPHVPGSTAYRFLDSLARDVAWSSLRKDAPATPCDLRDLESCLDYLLAELDEAGQRPIVRVDLTKCDVDVPVAKVLAPTLRLNRKLL